MTDALFHCTNQLKNTCVLFEQIISLMEREQPFQAVLARRFNCSQSAISKITKNKDALLQEAEKNKSTSHKWKWSSKDDVNEALFTWFFDARARDMPITSAVLKEKANLFVRALNKDFKATNR